MTLRRRALWGLLLAKAVAGIGVGWDIRWHIVIGRDSFWIAPHVMTYAGVAVAAMLSLGVLFHETWAARRGRAPSDTLRIAGLFLTFTLVVTARLAGSRAMPVVVAVAAVALQLIVIVVGDVGFAVLRPQPAVAAAMAADPASPIAIAHEIARRNGATPGRGFTVRLFPVLPAIILALVDPRRRPVVAGLAFGVGVFVVDGVMFMR